MGERSGDALREKSKPRARPAADKMPEKREKPRAPQTKIQEKKKEPIEHNRAIIHKACIPIQEPGKHASKIPPKIPPKAPPKAEANMQPKSPSKIPPKVINQVEPKKETNKIMPRQEPKSDAAQKEALRKRKGMFVKIGEEQSRKDEMDDKRLPQFKRQQKCEEPISDFQQMARELEELCKILAEKPVSDMTSNNEKPSKKEESESGIKAISKHAHIEPISDVLLDFKICKNCDRNLPIESFEKYGGERGKKPGVQSYRSVCHECRRSDNRDKKLIKHNVLKLRTVDEVFGGKCIDCGIGFEVLPALEFDHHDPSIKDLSWCDGKFHTLDEILEWKNKENIELRCSNCHTERHSSNFSKYQELIMKPDLFRMKPEEINDFLLDNIREIKVLKNEISEIPRIKSGIESWIRKRYVIESLYGGKCCGCGLDINNLPALEFHHIDPTLKDTIIKWNNIANDNEAMGILLKEECICLCGNCHGLIESKYLDSWEIISENAGLSARESASIESIAQKRLENINRYITEYKVKLPSLKKEYEEGKLRMPLKLDFEYGENYMKILIKINHLTELRENQFYRNLIRESLGIKRVLDIDFRKLLDLGYINSDDDRNVIEKKYYITKEGFKAINEFKEKNPEIFEKLKSEVKNPRFVFDPTKRIDGEQHKIRIYSNVLYNLVKEKGYNLFSISEIQDAFKLSRVQTQRIITEQLIPNEMIEMPQKNTTGYLEGSAKVYQLTEKSINIAMKEPNYQNKMQN